MIRLPLFSMPSRAFRCLTTCAGVVGILMLSGCATESEFGDRTAVAIYNQKSERIMEVTTRVFNAHGYRTRGASDEGATYVRPGTTMENAAYGTWMSGNVREQATVSIEPYVQGASLLVADVVLLRNAEDGFFREEKKMSKRARRPVQGILDEIAGVLSGLPVSPDAN